MALVCLVMSCPPFVGPVGKCTHAQSGGLRGEAHHQEQGGRQQTCLSGAPTRVPRCCEEEDEGSEPPGRDGTHHRSGPGPRLQSLLMVAVMGRQQRMTSTFVNGLRAVRLPVPATTRPQMPQCVRERLVPRGNSPPKCGNLRLSVANLFPRLPVNGPVRRGRCWRVGT